MAVHSNFRITGREVEHLGFPRFRFTMEPRPDFSMSSGQIEWLGQPPPDPQLLARLMREAGNAYAEAQQKK